MSRLRLVSLLGRRWSRSVFIRLTDLQASSESWATTRVALTDLCWFVELMNTCLNRGLTRIKGLHGFGNNDRCALQLVCRNSGAWGLFGSSQYTLRSAGARALEVSAFYRSAGVKGSVRDGRGNPAPTIGHALEAVGIGSPNPLGTVR